MKAKYIKGCVFTSTFTNNAFVTNGGVTQINYEGLKTDEVGAITALEGAMLKLNGAIPADAWICPQDYSDNIQIISKEFGVNLPAIIITAEYPDGTMRRYVLPNDVGGGKQWTQDELYEYVLALYNGEFGKPCESPWPYNLIVPDALDELLCKIPAYLWGAGAIYTAYKAYETKDNPGLSVAWGAGALYTGGRFFKSGGIKVFK